VSASHDVEGGAAIVEQYRLTGHVVVRGVLDAKTLEVAEGHLADQRLTASGIAASSPEHDAMAAVLGRDDRLTRLARLALDGEPELFGFTYLVKPPRAGLPVLWHQDGHPWREHLGIDDAVTLWVALDPTTVDNGCLRVIPGTHRTPLRPLRPNAEIDNVFGWECDPDMVDEAAAIDVELSAGDASIHHPALVHGSGPNRSAHRRAALSLRYRLKLAGNRVTSAHV
jgi:phytanoyl-CoA hydroxylase